MTKVPARPSPALPNRHGAAFLRRHLGDRQLEHAPTRLALVATDLATGEAVPLLRGNTARAVLASSAFPGVYPPVELDGRMLIDGGVVADVLSRAARAAFADVLVVQTGQVIAQQQIYS